ncbi:uncharacterized protein LOC125092790 isoform X2 [Lutra lutra]|nr:uncharacterized protein LOC125092790 isoform X2 [Lutra lutra]
MHLCLGHSRPPQQLPRSGQAQLRPLRPSRSCLARPPNPQGPKKQVVFADTKGLSLTSVHMFEDAVGRDSEEGSCHPSNLPRLPPPPSPCAPCLPAPGRDSGFPGTPADPERVPRAERGARGLPARHPAGAHSGFPEGPAGGQAHFLTEWMRFPSGRCSEGHPLPFAGKEALGMWNRKT